MLASTPTNNHKTQTCQPHAVVNSTTSKPSHLNVVLGGGFGSTDASAASAAARSALAAAAASLAALAATEPLLRYTQGTRPLLMASLMASAFQAQCSWSPEVGWVQERYGKGLSTQSTLCRLNYKSLKCDTPQIADNVIIL